MDEKKMPHKKYAYAKGDTRERERYSLRYSDDDHLNRSLSLQNQPTIHSIYQFPCLVFYFNDDRIQAKTHLHFRKRNNNFGQSIQSGDLFNIEWRLKINL